MDKQWTEIFESNKHSVSQGTDAVRVTKNFALHREWAERHSATETVVYIRSISAVESIPPVEFDDHMDWQSDLNDRSNYTRLECFKLMKSSNEYDSASKELTIISKYMSCAFHNNAECYAKWRAKLVELGYSSQALDEIWLNVDYVQPKYEAMD